MNAIALDGCRTDSLLGYLKMVGVFRIVAQQAERDVRCLIEKRHAVIETSCSRGELYDFLLDRYAPTPIVNPWNSGAGFDERSRQQTAGQTVARVERQRDPRWAAYRDALHAAETAIRTVDASVIGDKEARKLAVIREFRARCSDVALTWVDAAATLGQTDFRASPLLGTGGNDGRLDFSINFMSRALDAFGNDRKRADSGNLLSDALEGTIGGTLSPSAAIGQFSPWASGGVNAGVGFTAESLVNPWDYVLMLEGTVAFAGSIVKRLQSSEARASFPFVFKEVPAGFASASSEEASRGELWLPHWSGAISFPSLVTLLRRGRMELDASTDERGISRSAQNAFEALHAAMTLGTASGIESFARVAIVQRNGLAFTASHVGSVGVTSRPDRVMGILSRETLRWVSGVMRRQAVLGASGRAGLRAYEEALFRYGSTSFGTMERVRALRAVLGTLEALDRGLSLAPGELEPLPFLSSALLDNGGPLGIDPSAPGSWIDRVARAACSFGVSDLRYRLRFDLAAVKPVNGKLVYGELRAPVHHADVRTLFALLLERRVRDLLLPTGSGALNAGAKVGPEDFEALFSAGPRILSELRERVFAYSIIEPWTDPPRDTSKRWERSDGTLPVAFAALALVISRRRPEHDAMASKPPIDTELVTLLRSGNSKRAMDIVYRRLRSAGFAPVDFRSAVGDGSEMAGWALVPASGYALRTFERLAAPSQSHSTTSRHNRNQSEEGVTV